MTQVTAMVASKTSASSTGSGDVKTETVKTDKPAGKTKAPQGLGIVPEHIWGIRTEVSQNILHVEDNVVLYPSGSYLVFHNIINHTQQFISIAEEGNLVALGLSSKRCETSSICNFFF